jgi:ribosomal-protein-alanine N-acetyltransferase
VSPPPLVGSIGFGGRPGSDGAVEIGYSMLGSFQRRGYATEAMGALIDWAFSHPEVRRIRAHTRVDHAASIRVLEKNGLSLVGDGPPGHARFELARPG